MIEEGAKLIVLALVGVIAGFLNVNAGGGSLLTLPFLIFLGLPAVVANGTNRVAILMQNIVATAKFHQFKVIPRGIILVTSIPAVVGAVIGAQLAVEIDELLFKRILAIIMVCVIGWMFFGPKKQRSEVRQLTSNNKIVLAFCFLGIGAYGGFIQGGIGFLLMTVLLLTGYNLVQTNALKVLIVLIFTPFALGVFIMNGHVDVVKGLVLALGNGTGGWIASHLMVKRGEKYIRWIVMLTVLAFAVKLFFE